MTKLSERRQMIDIILQQLPKTKECLSGKSYNEDLEWACKVFSDLEYNRPEHWWRKFYDTFGPMPEKDWRTGHYPCREKYEEILTELFQEPEVLKLFDTMWNECHTLYKKEKGSIEKFYEKFPPKKKIVKMRCCETYYFGANDAPQPCEEGYVGQIQDFLVIWQDENGEYWTNLCMREPGAHKIKLTAEMPSDAKWSDWHKYDMGFHTAKASIMTRSWTREIFVSVAADDTSTILKRFSNEDGWPLSNLRLKVEPPGKCAGDYWMDCEHSDSFYNSHRPAMEVIEWMLGWD